MLRKGKMPVQAKDYRINVKQVVDTNEAKYSVTPDYYNVLQYSEDGPSS